jgi:two-component system sensor histidine kinase EvgS
MKPVLAGLALLIALLCYPFMALADAEPRHLLARATSATQPLQLDDVDRQWLQRRGVLLLGSSRPDYPPFEINVSLADYEGLSADYAGLIAEQLGVPVEVRRFASRHEAIAALRAGTIDLLGSSNAFEAADAQLSAPIVRARVGQLCNAVIAAIDGEVAKALPSNADFEEVKALIRDRAVTLKGKV